MPLFRPAPFSLLMGLSLGSALLACSSGHDDPSCGRAAEHYQQLRVEALKQDPVLSQEPGLAEEHARQTRDVATAPVVARCRDDAEVGRCVTHAATYEKASECL